MAIGQSGKGENKMTENLIYRRTKEGNEYSGSKRYEELRVEETVDGKIFIEPPSNIVWTYGVVVDKKTKTFFIEELDGA